MRLATSMPLSLSKAILKPRLAWTRSFRSWCFATMATLMNSKRSENEDDSLSAGKGNFTAELGKQGVFWLLDGYPQCRYPSILIIDSDNI